MESMEPNRNTLIVTAAIALIAGLAVGYFAGSAQGGAATEKKLMPLIDAAFPPPPSEFFSLTGAVTSIYGAELGLEIDDPDDYLPHLDGSPRAKEMRTAQVSASTAYTLINYARLDQSGNPVRTSFSFGNLKVGEIITVRSAENIRDAASFEATAVERVVY